MGAGKRVGQDGFHTSGGFAGLDGPGGLRAACGLALGHGEVVSQKLVERQPLAGGRIGQKVIFSFGSVECG